MEDTKVDKNEATTKVIEALTLEPKTAQEVASKSGVPLSSARKLLAVMAEEGTIRSTKEGRTTKYDVGEPEANGQAKGSRKGVRRPDAEGRDKRVLDFIAAQGFTGASKYDISDALDVTPGIAYLSVWRLMKTEQVVMLPTGSRRPVYATPDAVSDGGRAARADN
jgi:hypothetical protein